MDACHVWVVQPAQPHFQVPSVSMSWLTSPPFDTISLNLLLSPSWRYYQLKDRLFNVWPFSRLALRTTGGSQAPISHVGSQVHHQEGSSNYICHSGLWPTDGGSWVFIHIISLWSAAQEFASLPEQRHSVRTSSNVTAGCPAIPCPGRPAVSGVSVHLPGLLEIWDKTFMLDFHGELEHVTEICNGCAIWFWISFVLK